MIKIKNRYFERIKDTSQFNEDFIKNYNEESHEGYFLEFDVLYPEKLHDLHNDLSFFPERMKIEKVEKFVANSHDKTEYEKRELVTIERKRNHLVSEPNYHTKTFFMEYLLAIEMRKAKILMNKPVSLGLPRIELSKILIYEFWYDYVKLKYGEKAKLFYVYTGYGFIVYIKTDDIYKDITKDFETRMKKRKKILPKGKK